MMNAEKKELFKKMSAELSETISHAMIVAGGVQVIARKKRDVLSEDEFTVLNDAGDKLLLTCSILNGFMKIFLKDIGEDVEPEDEN